MQYFAGKHTGKDGRDFEIKVSDQGKWLAEVDGAWLHEDSRQELTDRIDKLTKRKVVKVSVPFTRVEEKPLYMGEDLVVAHGEATGLHSSNGNILTTVKKRGRGEVKEQITRGDTGKWSGVYFKPLGAEDLFSLTQLIQNKRAADKAYRAFIDEYGIDLRAEVITALDNAEE